MRAGAAVSVARELRLETCDADGAVAFHGESMLPLLRDGDALSVEPVSFDRLQPGDIVVHRFDDRYPAHRVVERLEDKLFLVADNWPGAVFEAWPEDLLGRVVEARRGATRLSREDPAWKRAATRALARYRWRVASGAVRVRARGVWKGLRTAVDSARFGSLGMPEAIQVNVSSVCNLACRMCPYLGVHGSDDHLDFMTEETFERLRPAIRRIGHVAFGGSGEPLYNKRLVSFIERVRQDRPDTVVDLITNGTLLSDDVGQAILRLGVDRLKISIDGATAETVQAIRRNSDFNRIVENVRRLSQRKRESGRTRPLLSANYMTGYGTYRELPRFLRLAHEIGIERVQLLEIQPSCHADATDNLATGVREDDGAILKYAIKLSQRLGITVDLPAVTPNACLFPYHPHVSESGEVNPCCFMDYDGRTLFDGKTEVRLDALSFGDVNRRDFRAIWNAKPFWEFRRRNKRGDFSEGCRTCFAIRETTAQAVARIVGRRPPQLGRGPAAR